MRLIEVNNRGRFDFVEEFNQKCAGKAVFNMPCSALWARDFTLRYFLS